MSNILSPDESIQQAIEAVPSGAVICLGEGSWNENLVIVGKSLTLRGAGAGKTVIRSAEEGRPVVWIEGDEIEVNLEGVTITRAYGRCSAPPERCANGLVIKGSARVSLKDSQVSDNGRDGLYVWDSAQVSLQGSTVSDNGGGGLFVRDSARVSLQGSTVSDNGGSGLYVEDSTQVSLKSSTVSGNGESGLYVWDSAQVNLQGSTVSDNRRYGLYVWDSAQVSLQESAVSGNGESGLWVKDSAQVSLQDSTVSNNSRNGLEVEDSAQVKVRESRFLDNARVGIAVWSEKAQVEGASNQMGGSGVDLLGYAPSSLRKPLVPQTDRTQLSVPGDYGTVQEAVDAVAPGGTITIGEGTYSGGITIWKPVTLRGAGREATTLQAQEGRSPVISILAGVEGVRLEKLTVGGSGSYGLLIYGQAHLEDLQVSDNGKSGLVVQGSAQVSLTNSQVSDNRRNGIEVWDSAQVSLQNSTVSDNGVNGLSVKDKAHVELTNTTIRNNAGWGIAACLKKCGNLIDCFEGTVLWEGRGNEIYDNARGDVCLP